MLIEIFEYPFIFISNIEPIRNADGTIFTYNPRERYNNLRGLPLHKYGGLYYCKFRLATLLNDCGIYFIKVNNIIKYIGRCKKLRSRFNNGYGQISPRNCYIGGQETNCRINNLLLLAFNNNFEIELWFYQTNNYIMIEKELIAIHNPEWNL